jgi:hypothetical protein
VDLLLDETIVLPIAPDAILKSDQWVREIKSPYQQTDLPDIRLVKLILINID